MTIEGEIRWDPGSLRQQGSSSNAVLEYVLKSDDPANDDRGDALDWLRQNAPNDLFGLLPDSYEVPDQVSDVDNNSWKERIWNGRVVYTAPERKKPKAIQVDKTKDPDEKQEVRLSVRSGSAGAGTRLYSKELIEEVYENTFWRWEQENAINRLLNLRADLDGESAGMFVAEGIPETFGTVEIVVETVRLNEGMTNGPESYLVKAADAAGRQITNAYLYYGFLARSLKLINFDASQRNSEDTDTSENSEPWDVQFVWQYAPYIPGEKIDLPPGLETDGPFTKPKRGHDYYDILYVQDEHTTLDGVRFLLPRAVRASIHRIYDEEDIQKLLKI